MKIAAIVLSVVGTVFTGLTAVLYMSEYPSMRLAWIVLIVLAILSGIFSIVQVATHGSHIVLAGVLGILFCGALGGIFTLVYGIMENAKARSVNPSGAGPQEEDPSPQQEERPKEEPREKSQTGYAASDYEAPSSIDGWQCPNCGSINTGNFCSYCGHKKE